MNQPLISVIVPIYNVEKYLDKCVDSIVNQTYKNLEIILVDDGSPDNCPAMCDEWAKKDFRIKVIHKANGGLSDARNFGLNAATGDYISLVDSDDYIEKDMLKILLGEIIANNSDIALCAIRKVNENYETVSITQVTESNLSGIEAFNKIYDENYSYVIACNKLYSKAIFTDLRYKKGKIHEDEFIIHHIYSKCNKVTTINKPLYNYLIRSNSIIGSGFSIKSMAYYEAMTDRLNLLEKTKYPENLKWKTKASLLTWCQEKLFFCKQSNIIKTIKYEYVKTLKNYIKSYTFSVLMSSKITLHKKIHIILGFIPYAPLIITKTLNIYNFMINKTKKVNLKDSQSYQ